MSFSGSDVWSFLLIIGVLLVSMLIASSLKRAFRVLEKSLIPVSVLGGIILLIISTIVYFATGTYLFDLQIFSSGSDFSGMEILELITYHTLGIGFIAMGMRFSDKKFTKERSVEVFNSGVTTVNTYLLQVLLGMTIVLCAMYLFNVTGLIEAAGVLLAFGFGQGTGQALNFGAIYEQSGLEGGANFGLTIAALGFLVACIGGVIYLNVLKKKGKIVIADKAEAPISLKDYQDNNEIPVVSSMDKFTVQIAIVLGVYILSYFLMMGLSALIPSLEDTLFGFNFFIGTLLTIPTKAIIKFLKRKNVLKHKVVNNFMMNRLGGFAFDLMIISGIAAIKLPLLADHWELLLIMALVGAVATFLYVYYVSRTLHKNYMHEQFLAMFGMLTGTASTGIILLREIDGSFRSPASENLVFQTLPAMVFGFPLMLLAPVADNGTTSALTVLGIVVAMLVVLNLLLFRAQIFRRKKNAVPPASCQTPQTDESPDPVQDQPTDPPIA